MKLTAALADYGDYSTQEEELKRKQAIAEAMMAQGMQMGGGTEMVGDRAVKKSPLEPILKVLQAYLGAKGLEDTKEEGKTLSAQKQKDLSSGMEQFMGNMTGTTASIPGGEGTDAYGGTIEHKANPRKAILDAMGSKHPMVQQLGVSQLGQLGKDSLTTKDWLGMAKDFTPKSYAAAFAAKDPSLLVPRGQFMTANDQVLNTSGEAPTPAFDARDKYDKVGPVAEGPDGPIMGQTEAGTGKVAFAPAPSKTTINNNPAKAEGALQIGLAGGNVKRIEESYGVASKVPQLLANLDEAAANLTAGVKSGQTAEFNLALSKLAKNLGMGDVDPTIANTEVFRAKMASAVIPIIEKLKPASDTDVKFAKEAAGGDIKLDDQTMLRLVNSARAAGMNTLFDHARLVGNISQQPGGEGALGYGVKFSQEMDPNVFELKNGYFVPKGPEPVRKTPGGSGTPGVLTLEQYFQQQQGKR